MATTEAKLKENVHIDCSTSRTRRYRYADNSILVWLVHTMTAAEEMLLANELAQNLGRFIELFTDSDECLDFITDITHEKIFLIVSEPLVENIVPLFYDVSIIHSIYILSRDTRTNEDHVPLWKNYSKIQDIYTDISTMNNALKKNLKFVDNNFQSTTIIPAPHSWSTTKQNNLDAMFMYCQLLKEIFLEMNHDEQEAKRKLAEFCKQENVGNLNALQVIDEFLREYTKQTAIRWYTRDTFLYRMLNKCLRLHEIEGMNKFGFFIKDLYVQLQECDHHKSSEKLLLYRG